MQNGVCSLPIQHLCPIIVRIATAFHTNPNKICRVFIDKCKKKQGLGDATLRELNNAQNQSDNLTVNSALDAAAMYFDNCKN